MMKEKKINLNIDDEVYNKYYYHPGDMAFKVVKFDYLTVLATTPLNQVK